MDGSCKGTYNIGSMTDQAELLETTKVTSTGRRQPLSFTELTHTVPRVNRPTHIMHKPQNTHKILIRQYYTQHKGRCSPNRASAKPS